MCLDIFLHQGKVYDVISSLPILLKGNALQTILNVCSLYFSSVFLGCVIFQVSRIFDVSSSIEKWLDTMVVFYDFVFPHNLQHQQRPELFLVSIVYHIFGAYFSVTPVFSRFCWLQSGMQQKFPISCLVCNCLAVCRSFFLCSIPLAWNWFYYFLYSPSPVP